MSPSGNDCEINLSLLTDKGSQYSGGVLKLSIDEMRRQEGNIINLPLSKCIDKEATCKIEVKSIKNMYNNQVSSMSFNNLMAATPVREIHNKKSKIEQRHH